MGKNLNIKSKLTFSLGVLSSLILLLTAVSLIFLELLTNAEPDSHLADVGLRYAVIIVAGTGAVAVAISAYMLWKVPHTVNEPVEKLINGIKEIANHNYDVEIALSGDDGADEVSRNFNRMAKRLREYHSSTWTELRSSKRYMETIINAISEPIIGLDNESKILFISDDALEVLNLKKENVLNKSAKEVALTNDLLRRLLVGLMHRPGMNGDTKRKEEPLKIYANQKESYFQVRYESIFMKSEDGEETIKTGDVIILKNVTEFQELDTAKTTFISTISHELKTPISAILMSLQLLENKKVGELNPEQKQLSDSIKDNSQRLLSITGELLNVTQVESGKLQLKPKITKPIELIDYAIKANRVQAERFGINVEVSYPSEGEIKKLFVDSEKIAWVLTNLLSNAIRYSPANSRVVIGARQADDTHIELFVKDNGKGIDPRYHESIFEHYFRVPGTKVQGSGLGLSISRDFVEAHKGTLTVQSEVGKGSTFVIRLHC